MMKEHYISNSVYNLKSIAKSHGLVVKYESKIIGFVLLYINQNFLDYIIKNLRNSLVHGYMSGILIRNGKKHVNI